MITKSGWIMTTLKKNWDCTEGIIDVGPIIVAHCDNSAKFSMIKFLGKVLEGEISAIIPVSSYLGAFHFLTRYLRITSE